MKYSVSLAKAIILQNRLNELSNKFSSEAQQNLSILLTGSKASNSSFSDNLDKRIEALKQSEYMYHKVNHIRYNIRKLHSKANSKSAINDLLSLINYIDGQRHFLKNQIRDAKSSNYNIDNIHQQLQMLKEEVEKLETAGEFAESRRVFANFSAKLTLISESELKEYEDQLAKLDRERLKITDEIAELNRQTTIDISVDDDVAEFIGLL